MSFIAQSAAVHTCMAVFLCLDNEMPGSEFSGEKKEIIRTMEMPAERLE